MLDVQWVDADSILTMWSNMTIVHSCIEISINGLYSRYTKLLLLEIDIIRNHFYSPYVTFDQRALHIYDVTIDFR